MKKLAKILAGGLVALYVKDLFGLKLYYLKENDSDPEKAVVEFSEKVHAGWKYAKDSIKKAWYKDM